MIYSTRLLWLAFISCIACNYFSYGMNTSEAVQAQTAHIEETAAQTNNAEAVMIFRNLPEELRKDIIKLFLTLKSNSSGDSLNRLEKVCSFEKYPIGSITYSPDETTFLVTGLSNSVVYLCDTKTGVPLKEQKFSSQCRAVTFVNKERAYLALADGSIMNWHFSKNPVFLFKQETFGPLKAASFSHDKNLMVLGLVEPWKGTNNAVVCWNFTTGECFLLKSLSAPLSPAAFNQEGTAILSASTQGTAHIEPISSEERSIPLSGHTDCIKSASFSKDSTLALTGSTDKTVCLWDASTGELLKKFKEEIPVQIALLTPSNEKIIAGFQNGEVFIWDCANETVTKKFESIGRCVNTGVLSSDGSTFLIGAADGNIYKGMVSPWALMKQFLALWLNPAT